MSERVNSEAGARTLESTVSVCVGMAIAGVVAGAATGHARAGWALAVGIGIGSLNGRLVRHQLGTDLGFRAASVARLGLLSAAGVAGGLLLGVDVAWLALIGLAVAQMVLALVAAREALSL